MSNTENSVEAYLERQPRLNQRRRILHPMLRVVGSLFCRATVTGREHIPASGATILMMNHTTFIDPAILTAVVDNRYVISMAKAESADHWLQNLFVQLWGNFYVRRGKVDRQALKNSMDILNAGHLMLMAPEGKRAPEGLAQPKGGLAYIAHKTGATIVPAAVCGVHDWTRQLLRLRRIDARVHFGRPFRLCLPDDERLSRRTRDAMMYEAMYQLARAIPDDYADLRGEFANLNAATTRYLQFI